MVDEVVAAVDVGTNSFHLLVARATGEGRFEPIAREKEMVRLGHGSGDMKVLQPDAIDRGVAALGRFRQIADISGARLHAVGTSAVREAENRQEFLDRARAESGVDVETISGVEEARLIYLGALQAVPAFDRRALVVDIGGGSTELVVGHRGEVDEAASLKLGAIRLTDRFFPDGGVSGRAVKECRAYVAAALSGAARQFGHHRADLAIGCSGTIRNLAEIAEAARTDAPATSPRGLVLAAAELDVVVKGLTSAGSTEVRADVAGLDPRRADIIVAGAVLLQQVFISFDLEEMVVSDYALREGVLIDALERWGSGPAHEHLRDVRRRGVRHLAELCPDEVEHNEHVAGLALQLYDGVGPRPGQAAPDREYLEAAALLANVGLVVAHSAHHRHSYYVIRNSDRLTGFTSHEVELVAQVARYHRKSAPKASHSDFAALAGGDQDTVRHLAGLLRVAVALDRTYSRLVRSVTCRRADDALVVTVDAGGADVSLELFTAGSRAALLEEVVGGPVDFEVAQDGR